MKKLFDEKMAVQRQMRELSRRDTAIDTALEIVGVRVSQTEAVYMGYMRAAEMVAEMEDRYIRNQPFKGASLPEACLTVINDHGGLELDKRQVEYALALGGYPFDAKDPTNSVEVTLRKLASEGKCDVNKGIGTQMSRYRRRSNANDVSDTDSRSASKTEAGER